ncbi:hypothetical protein ACFVRD_42595 [Streptomyces sp. NPDC057908]|uniref:hypothetical protein n=1 Tax=Streptomyces sp. NPDC057908 TaxID=3346276 RepID=UPI0036EF8031
MQAVLFGSANDAGFPSGPIGMVMAGGWALVLGIMRLRSGGILIPYIVRVAANAVIGTMVVAVLH